MLFFIFSTMAQTQNIGKIKLGWNYKGSLNHVLDAIGDDYDLHFVFDSTKLQNIEVTYYAFEDNSLGELFKEWKNQWNLFAYVEKNQTILISDRQLSSKQRKEWLTQLTQRAK
ncbi:MAG: hypothetical protein H6Q17_1986 [Bacteroidetes bacterium]|nr:hypothetical protein [Bacteroidota bacterium]